MDNISFKIKIVKEWLRGPTWKDRCPRNTARRMFLQSNYDLRSAWTCDDCAELFPEIDSVMGVCQSCPCLRLGTDITKARAKLFIDGELDIDGN